MKYLFVHQNFPGQFLHVVRALAGDSRHRVLAIADLENLKARPIVNKDIAIYGYAINKSAHAETHNYLQGFESQVIRGQAVARIALALKKKGFEPEIVIAHPGWGEALFLKDIFPHARHINYFEFYYRSEGSDVNFDPQLPSTIDDLLKLRIRNSAQLHALTSADIGVSPTNWQRQQYPHDLTHKIKVLHEGINTSVIKPDADAVFTWKNFSFHAGQEIITYAARNLEPYRGFHVFMQSLPALLDNRPNAIVLIVGGDAVSYGRQLPSGQTYRQKYIELAKDTVDWNRVHFLGKLPFASYLKVLQISSVHVYLTYPFVLSWSFLEAMSVGCAIVASNTSPVQEVVEDQKQALLFNFFDSEALVEKVTNALNNPSDSAQMRKRARATVIEKYDLSSICLPQWLGLLGYLQYRNSHRELRLGCRFLGVFVRE